MWRNLVALAFSVLLLGAALMANVGDGLIAFGEATALVGDGKTWKEIQVPSCEVGKRPV